MKAVQFQFNSSKHSVVDVPKPSPEEDEVLVKVLFSALDTGHQAIVDRSTTASFIHSMNKKAPLYLGYHFSGTANLVGSDVKDFAKGDEVFGFLQYEPTQTQGSFAEYIVVKKDALAIKPSIVAHAEAAASTTEALTALQAMRDVGGLQKAGSVLIVGAAGGVGSAGVQVAKALGAHVTAICSARDVAQVKDWGADRVVNRNEVPNYERTLLTEGDHYDVVFDTPNMLTSAATQLLKPEGSLVYTLPSLSFVWGILKTLFSKKKVAMVDARSKKEDLELLAKWLEDKEVKIPIDSTFKVGDIEAAVEKQESKKKGRVVIQVEGGWM